MDSPDQGAKGMPVTTTSFENSIIKLTVLVAGIQYEGTLNSENIFEGTFLQAGHKFPLNLSQFASSRANIYLTTTFPTFFIFKFSYNRKITRS